MRVFLTAVALLVALAPAGCGASSTGGATGPTGAGGGWAGAGGDGGGDDAGPALPPGDPAATCDDFTTISLDAQYADPACAGPAVIAIEHDPTAASPVALDAPTHDPVVEHLDVERFTASGCAARLTWRGDAASLRFAIRAENAASITGRGVYQRGGAAACTTPVTLRGDWAAW